MFKYNSQKGVSLIITFFIMAIILSVILSISIFLYNQIKIIRNIGNSVISFFTADSGVEKVLYYDRKSLPIIGVDNEGNDILAPRGLCSMYLFSQYPDTACPSKNNESNLKLNNSNNNDSLFCEPDINFNPPVPGDSQLKGCDPEICNNCTIAFNSEFLSKSYYVVASVKPSIDGKSTDFTIDSRGKFENTERKIKVFMSSSVAEDAIRIENACAAPKSSPQGDYVYIFALISVTDFNNFIGGVNATIRDNDGNYYNSSGEKVGSEEPVLIPLMCGYPPPDDGNSISYECNYKSDPWYLKWPNSSMQTYYVTLDAYDTTAGPNHKIEENILPCQ